MVADRTHAHTNLDNNTEHSESYITQPGQGEVNMTGDGGQD